MERAQQSIQAYLLNLPIQKPKGPKTKTRIMLILRIIPTPKIFQMRSTMTIVTIILVQTIPVIRILIQGKTLI